MTRYSCGCETCPLSECPPGVAMTLTRPNAASEAGWYEASDSKNGEHWHKPCRKHLARRMAKWMIQRMGLDGLV